MLIQSPGEKIKIFRKQHKIRQHELCGDIITRNMLSMIENNKTPLAQNTAQRLMRHIEQLCTDKDILCTLSLRDLLNTTETQIIALTTQTISAIDNGILENPLQNSSVSELLALQEHHNLSLENALLHYSIGSYFQKQKNFQRAYAHYLKTLANTSILQKYAPEHVPLTYMRATFCCIQLNLYEEVLNLYQLVYLDLKSFSDYHAYAIIYNAIFAYLELGQYNDALNLIITLEHTYNNFLDQHPDKRNNLLIMKGNTHSNCKLYDEAIAIYMDILSLVSINNLEIYLLTLINMSETFRLQENNAQVKTYNDQFKEAFPSYQCLEKKSYESTFNLGLALNCFFLGEYDESEYYYLNALKNIILGHQNNLLSEVINGLYNLILKTERYILLEDILNVFKDKNLAILLIKTPIPYKVIQLYIKLGRLDTVNYLTNLIIAEIDVAN